MKVILGPAAELHSGIHGQLVDSPPAGVDYLLPGHRHRYLLSEGHSDPFAHFAASETVEYALPPDRRMVVHASRVPVFNAVPWIADADCLLATVTMGTAFAMGTGGQALSDDRLARLRQEAMLAHYLNDHCVGLLLRTEHARRNLLGFVEGAGLLAPAERHALEEKCDVLRPTMPARTVRPRAPVPTVIYMGRFAEGKGGDVAIEVFRRLSAAYGARIRLIYVGPTTSEVTSDRIETHPLLERHAYLGLLETADIFLSPTEFESYGFALLEAASHGLALVTSRGPGMEHIEEQLTDGHSALFVPTTATFSDKVDAYARHVRALIEDTGRLRAMQAHNLDLFRGGPLSLEARDRKLVGYYARMTERLDDPTLRATVAAQCAALAAEHRLQRVALDAAEWDRRRAQQARAHARVLVT